MAMGALSAHLRAPEDHARLPFHPDCPVCRSERLTGVLPSVGLVSLRTQAALAAGVLAFSAAAPSAVLAAETDQEQQGAAAPGQSGGADTAGNPDFDPGGASTDLPSDAPPVPQPEAPSAGDDDAAPLDDEPANDVDAPVADAGDEPSGPNAQQPAAPATPPAPPSRGDPEQPASPTSPGPDRGCASGSDRCAGLVAHQRQFATPGARAPSGHEAAAKHESARARQRARASAPMPPLMPRASAPRSAIGVQPVRAPPTPSVAVAVGDRDAAATGDHTHVARPGESLWSIARDVLGGDGVDCSRSPARSTGCGSSTRTGSAPAIATC